MSYDSNNIFARILRGEIPNKTVFENDHALAFDDINPQAAVHCLVIPKGAYVSLADFSLKATADEKSGFFAAVAEVIRIKGLSENGFRAICNTGAHGGQEVPHFHMHIVGGEALPGMLAR